MGCVIASIFLGVFLQVGPYVYTSNTALKLMGLVFPLSIALVVFSSRGIGYSVGLTKLGIIWALAFAISILHSIFSSQSFGRTMLGSADRNLGVLSVLVYLMFFFAGSIVAKENSEKAIRWAVIAIASVQSLIVGFQKFLRSDNIDRGGKLEAPGVWGTFYNANPSSFYLGMISSAIFSYLLFKSFESWRRYVMISSICFLISISIFWTGSIQGLIGIGVASALYTAKRLSSKVNDNFSLIVQFFVLFVFFLFLFVTVVARITNQLDVRTNPYLERLEIYKTSLEIFFSYPLFGIGIDNFQSRYGQFTPISDLKLVDNAHSVILQVLVTQGLLGITVFLSLILWILSLKRDNHQVTAAQWNFWQTIFVSYVVIGVVGIDHPVIGSLAYLSAGILYGFCRRPYDNNIRPSLLLKKSSINRLFQVVSSIVLLTTLVNVVPEIRSSMAVYKLSNRSITAQEFGAVVKSQYKSVHNARLLLVLGQAMIAIDDQEGAKLLASRMLISFPDDQRTVVLLFAVADKWNDRELLIQGKELRNRIFPNLVS